MVDDLLRWNTAQHGGGLLSRSSYDRMIARFPETAKEDGFYGYGLFIGSTSGYTWLSHSGGVNGFVSMLQYYPELRASLIVLSNIFNPVPIQPIILRLSDLLLDRPSAPRVMTNQRPISCIINACCFPVFPESLRR